MTSQSRTLSLYVAREVLAYTLIGLAAVSITILTRNLVDQLDKLVAVGFALQDLIALVKILATLLAVYALPVAFLFGVLLAVSRMSADREITAMRACGVGLREVLVPVVLIGILLSAVTLELTLSVEPTAYREMSLLFRRMLVHGASIEPGRFHAFGGRSLYVDERGDDGRLRGVVLSDRSDLEHAFLVFAESGRTYVDEENSTLVLHLERGEVHVDPSESEPERDQRLMFEQLEYRVDVRDILGPDPMHRPRALPTGELREIVERIVSDDAPAQLREPPAVYRTNLQRRYAIPAAPLLFALVGAPLGMRSRRGGRARGAILCGVFAFGYYVPVAFCELLATEHGLPPHLVLWMPNLVFAVIGVGLVARARHMT